MDAILQLAEPYLIRVAGPFEADPPYAPTTVERGSGSGDLHVDLVMRRDRGE